MRDTDDNRNPETIASGIGWLMMQGQQRGVRVRGYPGSADYDPTGFSADDGSGGSLERAKSTMSDAKNRVSDTGHRLMDKASEMTGRARDAAHGARTRISGSAGSGRERMNDLSQRSQQQYYRARASFGHMLEEQPLVLGAIGLAIGAVLGATVPATRREDEMMGSMRDDLLEKAKETGREHSQTLKESAQRVADTARQEAQRVGSEASSATQTRGNGGAGDTASTTGTEGVRPATGLH
jgi:ElaB/YqjD/DUF883 family membrane-anchored ribosome-binding protein